MQARAHIYAVVEPPTPTSTATLRRANASSAAEDDILPTAGMSRTSHRSSSRTYRWVEDQQHVSGARPLARRPETAPTSMRANPYLAYPHLSATSLVKDNKGTIRTVESYVFVDDDAPHAAERAPRGRDANVTTQVGSRARDGHAAPR